jgi:hypothetical protein
MVFASLQVWNVEITGSVHAIRLAVLKQCSFSQNICWLLLMLEQWSVITLMMRMKSI